MGYFIFSMIDEHENVIREDGSVNWKSHYFTSIWCAISLTWCLLMWRGSSFYWNRYRAIYYEYSETQSVKESAALLGSRSSD
jgi:hypothetical protein